MPWIWSIGLHISSLQPSYNWGEPVVTHSTSMFACRVLHPCICPCRTMGPIWNSRQSNSVSHTFITSPWLWTPHDSHSCKISHMLISTRCWCLISFTKLSKECSRTTLCHGLVNISRLPMVKQRPTGYWITLIEGQWNHYIYSFSDLELCQNRIAAVPLYPNLCHFPEGQQFKQWTGDDSKVLMKVYLPAIEGHVPPAMVHMLWSDLR